MYLSPIRCSVVLAAVLNFGPRAQAIDPFTEEALQRGINYSAAYLSPELVGMAGGSQGACFADLDGDGDPDLLLVGRSNGVVGVFENDGTGHFIERSSTGMPLLVKASSVTAADYDDDGDLDVFMPQIIYPNSFVASHYLMRNDGNFQFTDVTTAAGILPGGSACGATWGDYDGDGYVDLYLAHYAWSGSPLNSRLYHNLGNGSFAEVAAQLGVSDPGGYSFQASFVDYDLDGDADLMVSNDRVGYVIPPSTTPNPDNRLFENLGNGTFQDVSASSGIGTNPPGTMFSMGIAVGDLDRNGWPDFYISNLAFNSAAHHRLHLGHGPGAPVWFTEQAVEYGMISPTVGWGVQFFDLDNDGWLDLYLANTPLGATGSPAPQLFHFTGTPPATDIAPMMGLDLLGGGYGVTTADIDNDGDMDLVVVRPYDRVLLYINHAEPANHWLKVRLRGSGHNRFAVGSTVFVQDNLGWQQRSLVVGNSYKSQEDMVLHFGVGSATVLNEVQVLWTDGTTKSVQNVATNQTLTICQTGVPAEIAYANPPFDNPYLPEQQPFRDVLQTGTGSALQQGIGSCLTPSEGAVSYCTISVGFTAPTPLCVSDVSVACSYTGTPDGPTPCPTVTAVNGSGAGPYAIALSGPIPPGGCTTITFANAATGQVLRYEYLPGDVNMDAAVSTQDLLALVQAASAGVANLPPNLPRYDVDRSGMVNTTDLLRLVQLLNSVHTTQVWNGAALVPCP
jgi:hypothetical protein